MRVAFLLLFSKLCIAQLVLPMGGIPIGGGGGGGTITLISHGAAQSTSGSGTATTASMNASSCSGGCFAAACVVTFSVDCTTATVNDNVNAGNYSLHSANYSQSSGATSNICLWYKPNIAVSSSMTVSAQVTGGFAIEAVAIFSNVATSSPADGSDVGASASAPATLQPGSITPSANNELGLTCGGQFATGGSPTVSGNSYTLADSQAANGSNNQNVGIGYVIQTTATAANPTWSFTGTSGPGGTSVLQIFMK